MGDHFLPRVYLRGFAQPGESRLWMYENGREHPDFLPIASIANENKLYGDLEPYLAKVVEAPANKVLRRIGNKETISDSDKVALSAYIYILRKRVPSGIKRFHNSIPLIAPQVLNELISKRDPSQPGYKDEIDKAKAFLDELVKHPPKEIWQQALLVSNEESTKTLSQMKWIFFTCEGPEVFITSDNPVFFDGNLGINKPESQVSFPISNHVCLLATWWKIKDLLYVQAKPSEVKEMNRRTAYLAARFIYAGIKRDWIATLLNKKSHKLLRFAPPKY